MRDTITPLNVFHFGNTYHNAAGQEKWLHLRVDCFPLRFDTIQAATRPTFPWKNEAAVSEQGKKKKNASRGAN